MKKFIAILLCAACLLMSVPGLAQAENSAKTEFITNYKNYLTKTTNMQNSMMNDLKNNTVKLSVDGNLTDAKLSLPDGTTISNVPGHLNIDLAFNIASQKASCNFSGKLSGKAVRGQVFLTRDGVIVTRETIQSFSKLDKVFSELGDINKLPQYVVYPIDKSNQTMFDQTMKQGLGYNSEQTTAVISLCEEILSIIPDSCFTYSDGFAVMELTQNSLASKEFVNNLKDHRQLLADKLAYLMNKGSNGQFKTEDFKKGLIDAINNLNPEDIQKLLKDFPLTITMKVYSKPDQFKTTFDLTFKADGDSIDCSLQSQQQANSNGITENTNMALKLDFSDLKMNLNCSLNGTTDKSKSSAKLVFFGNFKNADRNGSGKIDSNITMDWSDKSPVSIPILNAQNSMIFKPKPATPNNGIRILMNGEEMPFLEAQPVLIDGKVMLPLREFAEAMYCKVQWQPPGTIILATDDENLILTVNSPTIQAGEVKKTMNAPPVSVDGHVYVPVRFLAEYFGFDVNWNADLKSVSLDSK